MFVVLVYMMGFLSLAEEVKYLGFNFFTDTLSFSLCVLTVWLSVLMLVSSNIFVKVNTSKSLFGGLVLGLLLILMVSFFTSNYLMFYFFFEISLIPTLLIITGWGFQPERLQAGVYFMLYTLIASLPLLSSIVFYYYSYGSLGMNVNLMMGEEGFPGLKDWVSLVLSLSLIMAFLAKMPMFLVHLWLPKAHVEAPVAGSMILAGVLLKLGGYGVARVMPKFMSGVLSVSPYIIGLSLFGMLYVGFMCCRINDLKALVAYSSVAHMGLVLGGLFSGYYWGLIGGLMMMISHGISSSGLFCIVNMYYERSSSRSLFINKGLLGVMPIFSLMLFFLCAANVSAPPTINLLSEISLMISVLAYDLLMLLVFPVGSFLGAVFTFYLFSLSQHGKLGASNLNFYSVKVSDLHSLVLHVIPLNFLVLKSEIFFVWL
uniref:NADH-ubiquinone oxidoreductase chain 4 n=1 Tax=Ceratophysella communis TaxID=1519100 RepID=A0A6G6A5S6_9HEXA|nr:NADH dehydrogenase subunit 4 [Ceratophysella communis]QID03194.1 NADH dehydrogenase subunit 4 [Ceratophysella communis]